MNFDPNDKVAIRRALANSDQDSPIAKAVAKRIEALTRVLADAVEAAGQMPDELVLNRPSRALEEIALELWLEELSGEVAVNFRDQ